MSDVKLKFVGMLRVQLAYVPMLRLLHASNNVSMLLQYDTLYQGFAVNSKKLKTRLQNVVVTPQNSLKAITRKLLCHVMKVYVLSYHFRKFYS